MTTQGKSTPGPWKVGKIIPSYSDAENDYPGAEIDWTEVEEDGSTHPHKAAVQIWSVRAEANARLIAAAPELLAAAKEALDGMDGGEDHSMCHTGICSRGECTQCRRVDGLRAAIRRAEGR